MNCPESEDIKMYCKSGNVRASFLFARKSASAKIKTRKYIHFVCRSMYGSSKSQKKTQFGFQMENSIPDIGGIVWSLTDGIRQFWHIHFAHHAHTISKNIKNHDFYYYTISKNIKNLDFHYLKLSKIVISKLLLNIISHQLDAK